VLIDDEARLLRTLERFLTADGHTVHTAGELATVDAMLRPGAFDVLITDLVLQGASGIDIVRAVRTRGCDEPIILMTGEPSAESAAEAVRLDAFDYLAKPVTKFALLAVVARAVRYVGMIRDPIALVLNRLQDTAQLHHAPALDLADRLEALAAFARRNVAVNGPPASTRETTTWSAVLAALLSEVTCLLGASPAARLVVDRSEAGRPVRGDPLVLADALFHLVRAMLATLPATAPVRVSVANPGSDWSALDVVGADDRIVEEPPARTRFAPPWGEAGLRDARRIAESQGGRVEALGSGYRLLLPALAAPPGES
jgi:ActR/RegA family two-component response regulator